MKYKKRDKFVVVGGNKMYGEIEVQTSKNASLPIISASLLTMDKVVLKSLPDIVDISNMFSIMKKIGVNIKKRKQDYIIDSYNASSTNIDCKLSKTMRSSLFFLGSLLARFKKTCITLPGGCKIGKRPIDIHINALKKLNVKVDCCEDVIIFDASNAKPNTIKFNIPSVGATENIMQFACLLPGKTTIINPAKEPEVVDLANFLNLMGAKINGAGTDKITIYGVSNLHGVEYKPIGDRIVAGTIMTAVAMLGGNVTIKNGNPDQNKKLIEILSKLGCNFKINSGIIKMSKDGGLASVGEISTDYYPGFPTDLQSFMLVLSSIAKGKTIINENIFENRFLVVDELKKMGANISIISPHTVVVNGVNSLHSAKIRALDLRGGASLILAALTCKGETIIENAHYIDRGYDHIENIFSTLNLNIRRE